MGISIRTNVSSLNAQRNLSMTQTNLDNSLSKLSSGYRITKAGDDAAGLAISEKLRAQINGLNQAARNANDGISMIQTAEGALNEVHTMLQRMRELAVQASNDTLSTSDRSAVNSEVQQLKTEINGISARTTFNTKQLLTGSLVTQQNTGTSTALTGSQLNTTGGNATIANIDVAGAKSGETYTFTAGATAGDVVLTRSSDSVAQTISASTIAASGSSTLDFSQLGVKITLSSDAGGKTAAGIATDLDTQTVTTSAGSGSANFQIGANASEFINVAFSRIDISSSGMSSLNTAVNSFNTTQSVANAQALITAVDSSIDTVSNQRATYGAYQNRLDHTIANLNATSENLSASESRIRDVNVAEETAKMTRMNVLMQAGVSVLSQANQLPQLALKLLG